jgi:hypothetical protein
MNTPKTSDKTVVGSRVVADKSMDDEDADESAAVKDEDTESTLSREEISQFVETGSICCVDGVIRVVVGI